MAGYDTDWKDDEKLENDLKSYLCQGLQRTEMLDFVKRDYPCYRWSIRTLDRRLRHFDLYYIDKTISVEDAQNIVKDELNGPGKLLGYRAMCLKLRQKYDLRIPRDRVYDLMYEADPELLKERYPAFKKKKKKIPFSTKGPNWVLSLDGHDKLMGYQNSTFPLAVYGCIDTASRKILWLKVWTTNSKPELIGRWYLEYLYEYRKLPCYLRMDKGTETGIMATIHCFLRQFHDDLEEPADSIIYGPSTSNQIERWWKELHERLEKFFKEGLAWLKSENHYDPFDIKHRNILAYVMVPLMQLQLEEFQNVVWNPHRIRYQKDTYMADGIPNHIFEFPEKYNLENCGFPVQEDSLKQVGELSGVLDIEDDFLTPTFRQACHAILLNPEDTNPNEFVQAYLTIRYSLDESIMNSET